MLCARVSLPSDNIIITHGNRPMSLEYKVTLEEAFRLLVLCSPAVVFRLSFVKRCRGQQTSLNA